MARPKKKGLDYFPLDVYFIEDPKIKPLRRKYGADGLMIYIHILCKIYRDEGYYVEVTEDFYEDIAEDLKMNVNKVMQVTNFLVRQSLFDDKLLDSDKILTSTGIQSRYQKAIAERTPEAGSIDARWWLLSKEDTKEYINYAISGVSPRENPDLSAENHNLPSEKYTKESKVNKKKEKETILNEKRGEENTPPPPPTMKDVMEHCRKNGFIYVDPKRFHNYCIENNISDWRARLEKWDKEDRKKFLEKNRPLTPQEIISMLQDKGFSENDATFAMIEARKREMKNEY